MWFEKITIKNVNCIRKLEVTLKHGSVGVLGPNGAGKSTFLTALYILLTNDWSRFDGVKVDAINNQAGPKEEASIRGVVHHNGRRLEIYRGLRPNKHEVIVDGGKPITGDAKVSEALREILGIDEHMLKLYVFKPQSGIYDFLETTPAVRARAYATLCRTEVCEKLWSMLSEYLNRDTELNAVIDDTSDQLLADISVLNDRLHGLAADLAVQKKLLLNKASLEAANAIVTKRSLYGRYLDQQASFTSLLAALRPRHDRAGKECAEKSERLASLTAAFTALDQAERQAAATIKDWEVYDGKVRENKRLAAEQKAMAAERAGRKIPTPSKDVDIVDDLRKQLQSTEAKLDHARDVLKVFARSGVVRCPTCDTAVSDLKDYLEEQRSIAKEYPKLLESLDARLQAVTDYDNAVDAYDKWKIGFEARQVSHEKSVKALGKLTEPAMRLLDAQKVVVEREDMSRQVDQARAEERASFGELNKVKAELKTNESGQAAIEELLKSSKVSDELHDNAKKRLAEHEAASALYQRLEGQRDELRKSVTEKEAELDRLRARLKRSRTVRMMSKIIEEARDVLHRDRLPARVAQTNLAAMEGDINQNLEWFDSPFWVEADANLSFLVNKPGEPAQRAGQLSTGLKVILAVAFWGAVASLWGAEIGMLALDEPTANLDSSNRALLGKALEALTRQVRGRRQLIMVTHDDQLRSSFDQVVEVGK
jgi:DNA repair exonuclease SbcCD ATPase subunit